MIRAAFFDIDGTLLSFRTHRVSNGTLRAFARLRDAGVLTFIATGRPLCLIPQLPLHFDGHVTMNGGLVFTPDATLLANPIPDTDRDAWLDRCRRLGTCTMLFSRDAMMVANPNATGMAIRDALEFPMPPVVDIDRMRLHQAFQLIAVMPPADDALVAPLMPSCRMPRWHSAFTDIVAAGNNKAAGMDAICRHFGVSRRDTIAFGDGGNDIEMLQWAGTGIAMGNASDSVKAQADMVTASVDDEGIEQALNQLLP